ncbi:MAG TPA: hypothetical protein VME46_06125, partial [Acidimicrobiales bacterium]|nr:hypothetical protein [Acidimicrobiales bacterium]
MRPPDLDRQIARLSGRLAGCLERANHLEQLARSVKTKGYARSRCETDMAEAGRLRQEADGIAAELQPYEHEYRRRPWTRAFVVPGGHVHRSMDCSTCHPTTRFAWLPDYSGADEAKIVEDACERACTVCYP